MTIQPLDIAIDVSDNNPSIDWPKVHAAGIRIAFVKVMQSPLSRYPSGPAQIAGARAAGIEVVPYAFLVPADPLIYAREFVARAEIDPGGAFMLDWEGRAAQTCTPQVAEAIGHHLALSYGRDPVGYWGLPGSTPAAPTGRMLGWPRMVPRYPTIGVNSWGALPLLPRTRPEHYWTAAGTARALPIFAQYTAWGRVGGIAGVVDRSVAFFPSEADAIAWVTGKAPGSALEARNPISATAPAPAAVPTAPAPRAAPDDGEKTADDLNREELAHLASQEK